MTSDAGSVRRVASTAMSAPSIVAATLSVTTTGVEISARSRSANASRDSGRRLVTLTNGATQVAERLLGDAGIESEFERLLSVQDAPAWKPARAAYEYAAQTCGAELAQMMLVAVHPWDIDGAARAGMSTAWINRTGGPYPDCFTAPTLTVATLPELAEQLP